MAFKGLTLGTPFSMEPTIEAFTGSPYDAFEPDNPEDPDAHSPYMALARDAAKRAFTGRRGFSASTAASEDLEDVNANEPGWREAGATVGGYDGSRSAGGAIEPNPAGMKGGVVAASTPPNANVYDAPKLGEEDGPTVDEAHLPRQGEKAPNEKYISPEWQAVQRLDEEIASEKRESGSWGSILGGIFGGRSGAAQGDVTMRNLLAERAQLVRQAEWADNRRASEPVGKPFDSPGPDGTTHRYMMTRGGTRIDLGVAPEDARVAAARLIANAKSKALPTADGHYVWINPTTGKTEPLTEEEALPSVAGDVGEFPEARPAMATQEVRVKAPPQNKTNYQPIHGENMIIWPNPDGPSRIEKIPGMSPPRTTPENPDDKRKEQIFAEARRAGYDALKAEIKRRVGDPKNAIFYGMDEDLAEKQMSDAEKLEIQTKAARSYLQAASALKEEIGGKPLVPQPAPEAPPVEPTVTYTFADYNAKKPPKHQDVMKVKGNKYVTFDATMNGGKGGWKTYTAPKR